MERLTETIENEDGILGFGIIKCENLTCEEICKQVKTEGKHNCNNCPIQKAIEKLAEYEDLEEQGLLLKLPCKVGDMVYFRACCECVVTHYDRETNASECPFESDCEFEECNNGNERLFNATIDSIFNNGNGWYITLEGIAVEISVNDFGRSIFLTQAKETLERMERED